MGLTRIKVTQSSENLLETPVYLVQDVDPIGWPTFVDSYHDLTASFFRKFLNTNGHDVFVMIRDGRKESYVDG